MFGSRLPSLKERNKKHQELVEQRRHQEKQSLPLPKSDVEKIDDSLGEDIGVQQLNGGYAPISSPFRQDKSKFGDLPKAMKKDGVLIKKKSTVQEFLAQMKAQQELLNIDKEYSDAQALQEGDGSSVEPTGSSSDFDV